MPADYSSFQIKNTTGDPITLSVTDPDGRELTVGKLKPGQESHQVAPVGASWTIKQADLEPGSLVPAPAPARQNIAPATLLDRQTGKEKVPDSQGYSVEFIDDTSQLLGDPVKYGTTQYEAFLKLETGSHAGRINQLLVTPDGKSLITSGEDKTIRVWDIETRKQTGLLLGQIGDGDEGKIQAMAQSPDGKYLAVLAWMYPKGIDNSLERETHVRVYELATGNLQADRWYAGSLSDLDFSPDGNYLAMVGNPKTPNRWGRVYLFDWEEIIRGAGTLSLPLESHVNVLYQNNRDLFLPSYVRFIPENKENPTQYRIVVATWTYTGISGEREYMGRIHWYLCSREGIQEIQSCETEEFKRPGGPQNPRTVSRFRPVSLTVSREFVVTTAENRDIKEFFCYNHSGQFVTRIPSETQPAKPVFSKEGNQLIVGQSGSSSPAQVKVYDAAFGDFRLKSTYYGHDSEVLAVALCPDGTAVSAGGDQNEIHFWSTNHIEGERTGVIKGMGRVVHAVGIKQSGNEIEKIGFGNRSYLCQEDGRVVLQRAFDLRSQLLEPLGIQAAAEYQRAKKQLNDLRLEWIEQGDGNANLFLHSPYMPPWPGPLTGTPDPEKPGAFIWYRATTFGFTEKQTIITGDTDGKVRAAPQRADKTYASLPWRILVGHEARVTDHAASGEWLVTAGADQVIRIWYLKDVEEQNAIAPLEPALNLFVGADDEWVLWSKSGYYTASKNGDRYLGYHINRGPDREALFFSSDRFRSVFLRPDIIQAILTYGSEEKVSKKDGDSHLSVPPVNVADILPPIIELDRDGTRIFESKDTQTGFVEFTLSVESHGKPVTRFIVLRNGRLIYAVKPGQTSNRRLKLTLPLLPGANRIKVFAENQDAQSNTIKSNPIEQVISGKERYEDEPVVDNGTLHILSIGVSTGLNLNPPGQGEGPYELAYADKDAIAIAKEFAINKAFERVEKPILLVNEQATRAGILQALDEICQKITDAVNTRVENNHPPKRDALLVFLSGHGVYRIKDRQLYFWNFDYLKEKPGETGLSFMALGEKITSLPADVILMTDACHSGMAGTDVVKGFDADQSEIDPNELAARIYGINESDMYIFNAARRSEFAREGASVEHGYFTRAILDTLAASTDRALTMIRLIDEVQWRVPRDKQHPVCRMYGDLLSMEIYKK